ncbi:site-specific DNA-methyltransferase [Desulfitobacterium sp. Sab5]|uniref:site-specific DNA-methyltransferase n=1 Tax=Desulfitobacterium nosdiversum TaxID=3375356 RepID=UPI003CF93E04
MEKELADKLIQILQSGKDIPQEYAQIIFPIDHREYELTYKDKAPKEKILSVGEEPQSVPFQVEKEFSSGKIIEDDWKNLLIFGDNFQSLKTIYENMDPLIKDKIKGKVKLIYIDPPFATESDFITKGGEKAYADKVKGSEFIEFLRVRLLLAREILSTDGIICVHLDYRKKHYIKVIMDEVFGENNFKNEIAVNRVKKNIRERKMVKKLNEEFDTILMYSKTEDGLILPPTKIDYKDERWHSFDASGYRTGMDYELFGVVPSSSNHWRWEKDKAIRAIKNYEIWENSFKKDESLNEYWIRTGKKKKFIRKNEGSGKPEYFLPSSTETLCNNLWNDIPAYAFTTKYPTEKSIKMLSRIIEMTTQKGDIVMDFFAGSGTTLISAETMGRRWIGCDIGKLSIYTIQKRLLKLKNGANDFCLVNAGCYNLESVFNLNRQKYYDFVLELFHIDKDVQKINGIQVDGKRRGDWAKVFAYQDFSETTAINESYIQDLHNQIGHKIKDKFYLIAPEVNVDIIGDYYKIDNIKYYLLRIPYQVIADLHKIKFKKLQQPKNIKKINKVEDSIGFYFNDIPEVRSHIEKVNKDIKIVIEKVTSPFVNVSEDDQLVKDILAMVLIDSSSDTNFIMEKVFFADDIKNNEKYVILLHYNDIQSNKIKVVYIDIYGNEFMEVLEG